MPLKDPIKRFEYNKKFMKQWNSEHAVERKEYQKKYRDSHKAEKKQYNQAHKEKFAKIIALTRTELKLKAITHYGNGKCACVRCGFTDIRALSLDHIDGGGTRHRNSISTDFYRWLYRNNYPSGLQTLCMNCQFIKRHEKNELFHSSAIGQSEMQVTLPLFENKGVLV